MLTYLTSPPTAQCLMHESGGGLVSYLSCACHRVGVAFDQLLISDRLRVRRVGDLEHAVSISGYTLLALSMQKSYNIFNTFSTFSVRSGSVAIR